MDWLRNKEARADDWLESRGEAKHIEESGFTENWQTTVGQFIDEDLSISRFINSGHKRDRDRNLDAMVRDGAFPKDVEGAFVKRNSFTGNSYDYKGLAMYAKEHMGLDVQTDEELETSMRDELKLRRDYAQTVYARANGAGIAGRFAGTFHGAVLDPLTWPGMTVGVGAASSAVSTGRAMRTAFLINAGIAIAEETAIQPFVYQFKQDIDSPYTMGDALMNISFAAGGAGTIGATAVGLGRSIRAMKRVPNMPKHVTDAVDYMKREADSAPDPNMKAEDHFNNIESEVRRIDEARPTVKEDNPFDDMDDELIDQQLADLLDEEKVVAGDAELEELTAIEKEIGELDPKDDSIMGELKRKALGIRKSDLEKTLSEIPTRQDIPDVPTAIRREINGDIVTETKPLREVLDGLDAEEEKMLALKECVSG